jgi:hypothetical protein
MSGDAGLRLAQNGREIRDRQLGFAKQSENAQPRCLARGFQTGGQPAESKLLKIHAILHLVDIRISLYR